MNQIDPSQLLNDEQVAKQQSNEQNPAQIDQQAFNAQEQEMIGDQFGLIARNCSVRVNIDFKQQIHIFYSLSLTNKKNEAFITQCTSKIFPLIPKKNSIIYTFLESKIIRDRLQIKIDVPYGSIILLLLQIINFLSFTLLLFYEQYEAFDCSQNE
ncbi:hypothetical protein pb186bvf_021142 [Paramecium bursaria]